MPTLLHRPGSTAANVPALLELTREAGQSTFADTAYAEENTAAVTLAEEDVMALLPFTLTEPQDSGQQTLTPKLPAHREQRQGVFHNYPQVGDKVAS